MPPQGMEGQMMPPNPQEQMAPPQGPPQGGEGAPPTQLPPELQQILMSLPENVKKYILSLPVEQQIVELQKVAQGQMQATQNSPNQMMQQQMNEPPQGQMPMGKYGGRFQTGGYKGIADAYKSTVDNTTMKRYEYPGAWANKFSKKKSTFPNRLGIKPSIADLDDPLVKLYQGNIKPIKNHIIKPSLKQPVGNGKFEIGGGLGDYSQRLNNSINSFKSKGFVTNASEIPNWKKTQTFYNKLNTNQQSNPNVAPQTLVVQPTNNPTVQPTNTTSVPKIGDAVKMDGITRTIIKYGNDLGYTDDNKVFHKLNIAATTPVTAGKNVVGNIGFNDVSTAQSNAAQGNVPLSPSNTSNTRYAIPTTANPNTVAANPNTSQSNGVTPRPKVAAKPSTNTGNTYSGSNNMNTAPTSQSNKPSNTYDRQYTPSDTYLNEQIAKSKIQKQSVDPQSANPNLPQNAPKVIVSQNTRDKSSKHYENRINSALQSLQNADKTASNYERMLQAGQLPDRNIAQKKLKEFQRQKQIAYDNYNKLLQDYETMQQYEVKQYGGKLYKSGGYIDDREVEPIRKDYIQYGKNAGKARYKVDKLDNQLDNINKRQERREDRGREGKFLYRVGQRRFNKKDTKKNAWENRMDTNAYNREIAAQDMQKGSGFVVAPLQPRSVQYNSPTTTPQALIPSKYSNNSSVVVPNSAQTNTVAPRVTTSPNSGSGLARGGTQAVADYQKMLNEKHGTNLKIDGAWGPKTQAAYENFIKGSGKSSGNNSGGGSGNSVTAPVTSQPAGPQNQQPATGPREQSYLEKEAREAAGGVGKVLSKVASYVDPGSWASWGLEKAGVSKKWADRIGTGVSIGSMFIPGLGIASGFSKAGKVIGGASQLASKFSKAERAMASAAKASDKLISAGKVVTPTVAARLTTATKNLKDTKDLISKGVTHGSYLGDKASKTYAGAKNLAKQGIGVGVPLNSLGAAGVAASENRDRDALGNLALSAVGGLRGASIVKGVNKSKVARREMADYAKIKGVEHKLDKASGLYVPVNVNTIAGNQSYKLLESMGAGNKIASRSPILRELSPGNFADDMGNIYNSAGKLIGKAGTGIKNAGKGVARRFRRTPPTTTPPTLTTPPALTTRRPTITPPPGGGGGGRRWAAPKYGGQIYKSGGKMKYNTCKYGC